MYTSLLGRIPPEEKKVEQEGEAGEQKRKRRRTRKPRWQARLRSLRTF